MKHRIQWTTTLAVAALLVLGGTAFAQTDFGQGPGCSAIGGVTATDIVPGDSFRGRIGTTGVTGLNPDGSPADNSDSDNFTDSLEECINDSLIGLCTDIDRNDAACIQVSDVEQVGNKGRKSWFTVTFLGECTNTGSAGQTCISDDECDVVDEGVCEVDTCTNSAASGESCSVDDDCDRVTEEGVCEANPACCAVTECSDQADNDVDGQIDYPEDEGCANYSEDDELPAAL